MKTEKRRKLREIIVFGSLIVLCVLGFIYFSSDLSKLRDAVHLPSKETLSIETSLKMTLALMGCIILIGVPLSFFGVQVASGAAWAIFKLAGREIPYYSELNDPFLLTKMVKAFLAGNVIKIGGNRKWEIYRYLGTVDGILHDSFNRVPESIEKEQRALQGVISFLDQGVRGVQRFTEKSLLRDCVSSEERGQKKTAALIRKTMACEAVSKDEKNKDIADSSVIIIRTSQTQEVLRKILSKMPVEYDELRKGVNFIGTLCRLFEEELKSLTCWR